MSRSALQGALLDTIQHGSLTYRYKGLACLKNPFDLALYQMLIGEARPATILEIGSFHGGSAVWLADQMRLNGRAPRVHSVDLAPPDVVAEGVTFHQGDARRLGGTLTPELLAMLPRPWLVIEDAGHEAAATLAAMTFFRDWLDQDEYLVVEDGIVRELGIGDQFGGGPVVAIERFLRDYPGEFAIDRRYCDWYGANVTWNVDGYLRRVTPRRG
jgi:cephalosporin hydroxylase